MADTVVSQPANSPPRVTPTVVQPVRIPWGDAIEQFIAHEEPIMEKLAEAGVKAALGAVPFGSLLSGFVAPTVADQAVQMFAKTIEDTVAGQALTISKPSAIEAMAIQWINEKYSSLVTMLENGIDPFVKAAIAKL